MTIELEDRLWAQLEAAADRNPRRGRVARGSALLRGALPATAVAGAALAAAVAVVLTALSFGPHADTSGRRIERIAIPDARLGATVAAAGSLWSYDAEARQVLRIDPRTRHISARLPLPGRLPDAALAAGAGSVWAVPAETRRHNATEPARAFPATLARIDPATGRVVARVVLRGPGSATLRPLGVVARSDAVWVWGEAGALRIDPATGRIVARVRVPDQRITGFAVGEASVAVATDFGNVVSFDARSGAEIGVGEFTAPAVGALLVATPDGAVVSGQGGTLALIDPQTGDARWTRHLGSQPRDLVTAGGRVWTLVADPVRARSVLLALDPADGRTVERIAIPAEDARALAFDGADPLVTTQSGELLVARP